VSSWRQEVVVVAHVLIAMSVRPMSHAPASMFCVHRSSYQFAAKPDAPRIVNPSSDRARHWLRTSCTTRS
jgi:hypothetical protein